MDDRQRAYFDLLSQGLVAIRNFAHTGQSELCRIEADHLHNIPSLIEEENERRHTFYLVQERGYYLERLRQLGADEYLESMRIWYAQPWKILAERAGVILSE